MSRPAGALFVAGQAALPISLPLRFMVFGLISLLTGMLTLTVFPNLLATYHYNQHIISVTHMFTLGFITSVIMGATYQLVPVALETRLHSPRLAQWQFAFHLVGAAGMVWMFWKWNLAGVGHFGTVLSVGVALFAYNIVRTLRTVPRWNVVATAIASSVTWLSLTVLAGLAIAAAKSSYELADQVAPASITGALLHALKSFGGYFARFDAIGAMHAHAHLGGLGFIVLLIVGVSYRLVPMFTLSDLQSERRASASIWLLNLGLAGLYPAILLRSPLKLGFALAVSAGLVLYFLEIRAVLKARKRPKLDWALRYFVSALVVLGVCGALGILLSWHRLPLNPFTGQLENLYGFLALVGVATFCIIGMLYKIVPFLVWYVRYSQEIGRRKVPALADLYSTRLQALGYWTYLAGLGGTSAAILAGSDRAMRVGCGLLVASLVVFLLNTGLILRHLVRPRSVTSIHSTPIRQLS